MIFNEFFPAKLLLFGEHSILQGSQALAVPYPHFGGRWIQQPAAPLEQSLLDWANYLFVDHPCALRLDAEAFKLDLLRGARFSSNIPIGYGLGSSGALTASVWAQYQRAPLTDWTILKAQLGWMESFFHGASSGTDPLICYLQKPVVLSEKAGVVETQVPAFDPNGSLELFLLDTQIPRKTGPLVQGFLERCQNAEYQKQIREVYNPVSDQLIADYLHNRPQGLFAGFAHLSQLQWELLSPMIPEALRPFWQQGLASGNYYLKLCGAGGGGFLLGIRQRKANLGQLTDWPLIPYQVL